MSHEYSSRLYLLQNYNLTFSVILANIPTSYIVGLAYNKLGGKHVNIIMPGTIPNNTALIIMLYEAYHPSATINIAGPGQKNIKIIIWATYKNTLYFSPNLVHKRISYAGKDSSAVNKVAQNEFGKEANDIYTSDTSPVNVSVSYFGKY